MLGFGKVITALLAGAAVAEAALAAEPAIDADKCAIAAGRDVRGNTLTCNFGLSTEQLRQVTDAAVRGATAPLIDRIAAISQQLGVTQSAAETLLRIVGEQKEIPIDRLGETLLKVAEDFKRQQAQLAALHPDDAVAQELVARALVESNAGRFDAARALLRQAGQAQVAAAEEARKLREQAQKVEDTQILGAAALTAAQADIALTERNYRQAAGLFADAAKMVPAGRYRDRRLAYIDRLSDALLRQGDERGDNNALRQSIDIDRQLLAQRTRETAPGRWASTQTHLAVSLSMLGERESGSASLEQAIEAYRAALEVETGSDWAKIQMNLGNALEALGSRETGTARLEQAVAAYNAALDVQPRDQFPEQWAMIQINLGIALRAGGAREAGTERLKASVRAFRSALEVETKDRAPQQWALANLNLGNALWTLGDREGSTPDLLAALAAFHDALLVDTHERFPMRWSSIQMGLGNVLQTLGLRNRDKSALEASVAAFQSALQVQTRDRAAMQWAGTQMNLANTLAMLSGWEPGSDKLEQSLAAYDAALSVFVPAGAKYYAEKCAANRSIAADLLNKRKNAALPGVPPENTVGQAIRGQP